MAGKSILIAGLGRTGRLLEAYSVGLSSTRPIAICICTRLLSKRRTHLCVTWLDLAYGIKEHRGFLIRGSIESRQTHHLLKDSITSQQTPYFPKSLTSSVA